MKCFYLNPVHLNKWMHQNKAEYTGNFIEGCLLDNFILDCKRGTVCVYEHYLNPNSSDYYIEYAPASDSSAENEILSNWFLFEERATA